MKIENKNAQSYLPVSRLFHESPTPLEKGQETAIHSPLGGCEELRVRVEILKNGYFMARRMCQEVLHSFSKGDEGEILNAWQDRASQTGYDIIPLIFMKAGY